MIKGVADGGTGQQLRQSGQAELRLMLVQQRVGQQEAGGGVAAAPQQSAVQQEDNLRRTVVAVGRPRFLQEAVRLGTLAPPDVGTGSRPGIDGGQRQIHVRRGGPRRPGRPGEEFGGQGLAPQGGHGEHRHGMAAVPARSDQVHLAQFDVESRVRQIGGHLPQGDLLDGHVEIGVARAQIAGILPPHLQPVQQQGTGGQRPPAVGDGPAEGLHEGRVGGHRIDEGADHGPRLLVIQGQEIQQPVDDHRASPLLAEPGQQAGRFLDGECVPALGHEDAVDHLTLQQVSGHLAASPDGPQPSGRRLRLVRRVPRLRPRPQPQPLRRLSRFDGRWSSVRHAASI